MIFIFFSYWICSLFLQKVNPCFLMLCFSSSSPSLSLPFSFSLLFSLFLSQHTHLHTHARMCTVALQYSQKRYLRFLSEIFMIRNKLGTDMILKTTRMTNVVRKIALEILEFLGCFQNGIWLYFDCYVLLSPWIFIKHLQWANIYVQDWKFNGEKHLAVPLLYWNI